ncbi:MAG: TonB-dependent receptor plug domain-containing protein, partial [Gammaproteobacteria bacterium]|nr:TonB-dependent receptor plug domain-containing protein [Gammaproteobacteria bacterium]
MFKKLITAGMLVACAQALTATAAVGAALEEIHVTAIRGTKDARESVSAVSIVSRESLAQSQPAIITDALKGAPGVFVQQTTPGQGTAIIRGLKGSEILHLVDGMRLNNALFRNAPNQYLALIDPWIIERSDIVRGPLSSIYGSDAMGGVVHLISSRPSFTGEQWNTQSRFRVAYDSSTLGQTFNAAVASGRDGFATGASFSYQSFDDVRAADRQVQAPSGYRARAASAFTVLTDKQDRLWDLSVQFLEQPATPRYDELVPGFGQTQPASQQFLFMPNSRLFVHGSHKSAGYGRWLDALEIHLGWQQMRDG